MEVEVQAKPEVEVEVELEVEVDFEVGVRVRLRMRLRLNVTEINYAEMVSYARPWGCLNENGLMPSLPPPDSQLSKAADRSEVGLRKRGAPVAEVVPDVHRYN